MPFNKKSSKEKLSLILPWLLHDIQVLEEKQIELTDLLPLDKIDVGILEVNISILKSFFESNFWNQFKGHINEIKCNAK